MVGNSAVISVVLGLCTGCGQGPAPSEQATVDAYLAAAKDADVDALRALMAYQPNGDPGSMVAGATIPIACARIERKALLAEPIALDVPPRLQQISPAVPGGDSTKLDVAFISLRDGAELGRQLIRLGGRWYVLADANDECNRLFDR